MISRLPVCCSVMLAGCLGSFLTARAQSPTEDSTHFQRSDDATVAGKVRPPSFENHLRLDLDIDEQPIAMQTSVARFEPANMEGPLVVDLISVVHIGDRAYYDTLDRLLDSYDVVLYELVAPPERRIPNREKTTNHPLRLFQRLSQAVFDLTHQLEHIDYSKNNFVHADMSPQEMKTAIKQRGDDQLTLFLGVTADMIRMQNLRARELKDDPEQLRERAVSNPVELMIDPYGAAKLKRIMAQEFATMAGVGSGLGETLDRILIQDRNDAAIRVFQKELVKGHKRIGIFYGAAHMPDFERRLTEDFGMRLTNVKWLTAWDLRMIPKSPVEGLIGQFVQELIDSDAAR